MWATIRMNTLVQVSLVDSPQQGKELKAGALPYHWDLSFSDTSLLSVYCFIKNFIGSQTAPEKLPSDVGQPVDISAGSTAPTGASTVAIDNKIEQAMDLVKSHLMFAVREEVEVLKEKITELLERISQLEHENDILRANASAETLKQLNSHKKLASTNSTQQSTT